MADIIISAPTALVAPFLSLRKMLLRLLAVAGTAYAGMPEDPSLLPKSEDASAAPAAPGTIGRGRMLQGALDADICDASIRSPITNSVGTIHDDQNDEVVDCTTVRRHFRLACSELRALALTLCSSGVGSDIMRCSRACATAPTPATTAMATTWRAAR